MEYYTIGSISYNVKTKSWDVVKEPTSQGFVFKSEENFREHPGLPCYVPELSDDIYTKNDFLRIARGNHKIAFDLFDMVDWQSPETLLCDMLGDSIIECENCGNLNYAHHDECFICHKAL